MRIYFDFGNSSFPTYPKPLRKLVFVITDSFIISSQFDFDKPFDSSRNSNRVVLIKKRKQKKKIKN